MISNQGSCNLIHFLKNCLTGSSPLQSETVGNMNHGQPALPWANFASIPNGGTTIPSLGVPNANTHYGFNSNPINVASLSSSQSLDLSPKVWGSSAGMNPFMVNLTADFFFDSSHLSRFAHKSQR